ncbi:hypothetical protein PR002_g23353 [Phytophthora rubi]|uniref:Guanylate cyclase domain-containing protein n=3 Tax=Phytophthora rubi TaxID=129364 RepID=A0A6A3ILW0_9STRA|nr:hypothetical protein PR002_g23353 [Phytophthora rubi]
MILIPEMLAFWRLWLQTRSIRLGITEGTAADVFLDEATNSSTFGFPVNPACAVKTDVHHNARGGWVLSKDREEQITGQVTRAGPQMPALSASSQRGIPVKQIGGASSNGGASDSNDGVGPKRALRHAMTLSHFPSNRSLNKVAPEDVVPPPPLTRKQQVLAFVENKYVSSFMTACTIFTLFGDDFRVSFFPKNADTHVYNLLFALFIFFTVELVLNVYSRPNYFNRGRGFSFYMDLISTLSVIPDVDWIWVQVVGSSSSSSSQAAALKAGRASRAGTKAGRIVRLVRLFRVLRILRVVKKNKNGEAKKVQISEPSKIGKVLTEKTTRRLIVLVLLIIIVSPIIDGTVDPTQDDFQTSQFERLHRYSQDYNTSGSITMTHMQSLVSEYVRDSNGLLVQMELTGVDNTLLNAWLKELKFQSLSSDGTDWQFGSEQTLTTNPKTGWSASYLTDDPSSSYRSTEITTVDNLGCYLNDVCVDCDSSTGTSSCHSFVTYDISSYTKDASNLNIGKTIIVMFCFAVSIFVLTKDAESMVIGPIERMMRLVTQLAQNPLGSTEAKREEYEEDTPTGTDYETKMLEDTLSKIGRLLQVGFGAAGTEIIAKNMGGAGDLDVMIPGKKITSVFGFGIIEHFTETCSILEEDVITYINTIAEIVHGDAKVFHGAANKNIGSAFLLAWKICDGSLPGMRDPRDPADKPRMLPADKARKREGIYVKSAGSGTAVRRIGPTELVDSALTAVLKMRVDIHNANHHGTLHKYCNNTKLIAAFDNFEVHLGFGLHIGWAIEGAIGSRFKIDASYLSPNVNMAARLEAATGQFDVPMLISEWFVDELSAEARRFCRKIDRVAVKGSEIPMDLWTFDIGRYPAEGITPEISSEGRQKPVEFGFDAIYPTLQEGIPSAFFSNFHEGIGAYFAGKWDVARDKLTAANQIWEDGPTKVVLKVMETEGRTEEGEFAAPNWWKGYRQLTEK